MLSSRKLDGLEAAAAEIGGDVEVFAAHAGKPEDAVACIDATIERFGGLDILVNNAGANPYYGFTLGVDEARYDKTFEVNLRGPLFWSQVAWNKAFKDKPGVIMNIASVGGLRSEFGLGIYNITKAAMIHMTRQLAGELGPTRVVGIAPGLVKTDFAGVPRRELRRRPRRPRADEAPRRPGGHRQPGHVPGQRPRQLDHRRHLRHRRRRRGGPEPLMTVESSFPIITTPDLRAGARLLPRPARRATSSTPSRPKARRRSCRWTSGRRTSGSATTRRWICAAAQRIALWVYTDDCDALVDAVRAAGGTVIEEPTDEPWGERVAHVTDPDGNRVIIGQRLA